MTLILVFDSEKVKPITAAIRKKVKALREMTVARGCTVDEAATAMRLLQHIRGRYGLDRPVQLGVECSTCWDRVMVPAELWPDDKATCSSCARDQAIANMQYARRQGRKRWEPTAETESCRWCPEPAQCSGKCWRLVSRPERADPPPKPQEEPKQRGLWDG